MNINEIFLVAIFDCPVLSCALMLKKEITAVETAVTGICFCKAWFRKIWVQSKLSRVANIDNTIPLLQCPYFHLERAEVFALLKLDLLDLFFPSTANLQYSYNMRWGTCRWDADLLISVFLLSEAHDTPSYFHNFYLPFSTFVSDIRVVSIWYELRTSNLSLQTQTVVSKYKKVVTFLQYYFLQRPGYFNSLCVNYTGRRIFMELSVSIIRRQWN